ncbi:murein hydrolase activator EnvC family protein [Pseudodesulfovibrio piezophilus]|nr:M23 family metallopeptidase [Pseudodesulfovibrio piezophilus]
MKNIYLPFALFLFLLPFTSHAMETGETLHKTLLQENKKADDKEVRVKELTRQAGKISLQLSSIEHGIRSLSSKISSQERILRQIRQNEKKARSDHFILEAEKAQIKTELSSLMKYLWPIHLQNIRARFEGVQSWDMFDRRFNWLACVYGATQEKMDEAQLNSDKISNNLERQQLLEKEAETQLSQINKNKDNLLKNKYILRKNLSKTRRKKQTIESELNEILATIEELKYQLQSQKNKKFTLYKRALPWPVHGHLLSSFNLQSKPPRRGLTLGTTADTKVQSVFWGKVVHNDTLRGFGHVVIVYHGYDYYSLYAYLSKTYVRNGQEVEKDEPLGVVGYSPKVGGPGLYFELRFHQKPINPKLWLTALR